MRVRYSYRQWGKIMNKTGKNPCPRGASVLVTNEQLNVKYFMYWVVISTVIKKKSRKGEEGLESVRLRL